MAEAKAAINPGLAGAKSAFQHNSDKGNDSGSGCGSGDSAQRDELLAKIAAKKEA
jgi:hypothetical protein